MAGWLGICALVVPLAVTQDPLQRFDGLTNWDWFGASARLAGDVDADGTVDIVIGAPQNWSGFHAPVPGYARVFSGATMALLWEWQGDASTWVDGPDDHFGHSVDAAGDVDLDGHADVLVGAFKDDGPGVNSGEIRVYSGASGALLYTVDGLGGDHLGYTVSRLGDVDGDGHPDLLAGSLKNDQNGMNAGRADVFSGLDGHEIYHRLGDVNGDALGSSVARIDDLDGDGIDDWIAGAMQYEQDGRAGYARVYSGATGTILGEVQGDGDRDHFGWSVTALDDWNGDGLSEFAVGATEASYHPGNNGPGYVRVFSGADFTLLLEVRGLHDGDLFGYSIDDAGDVDGDGVRDLVVGAPRLGDQAALDRGGYVRVFSGASGAEIQRLWGARANDFFGHSVARAGDWNGDGREDLLIGAPEDYPGNPGPGYVVLHSGISNPPPLRYCIAAPNSTGAGASLSFDGAMSVEANALVLQSGPLPPSNYGLFFYGSNSVQLPFGNGYRCVGGSTLWRLPLVNSGPAGRASHALDFTDPPFPGAEIHPGSSWCFQHWYRDPPGGGAAFNLSDALRLYFHP